MLTAKRTLFTFSGGIWSESKFRNYEIEMRLIMDLNKLPEILERNRYSLTAFLIGIRGTSRVEQISWRFLMMSVGAVFNRVSRIFEFIWIEKRTSLTLANRK